MLRTAVLLYLVRKRNKRCLSLSLSLSLSVLPSISRVLTSALLAPATVSTWRNYTHHGAVSSTAAQPTNRNSKRDRETERQRERERVESGIEGIEISKTGRGRIPLYRIAPIRARVNLHSIKFVVIKSISAIQPAWPWWGFTHTHTHTQRRNRTRAHPSDRYFN